MNEGFVEKIFGEEEEEEGRILIFIQGIVVEAIDIFELRFFFVPETDFGSAISFWICLRGESGKKKSGYREVVSG